MITSLYTYCSNSTDPYANLALEEHLTRTVPPHTCILYLWQNSRTVVIGKNQNCWRECRVQQLLADGGRLARRLSGGGAVYHDLGNVNFTLICRKEDFDIALQASVILRAVQSFGLPAEQNGRNDLIIPHADGSVQKFSGNAFYRSAAGCYHHGTLLVNADLTHMGTYLNVSAAKLRAKGVASVKSRVVNLQSLCSDITVQSLQTTLITAFGAVYNGTPQPLVLSIQDVDACCVLQTHYASDAWLYGTQPPFENVLEEKFPWGEVQLHFAVENGTVKSAAVFSDAMDTDFIPLLECALHGCPYTPQALQACVRGLCTDTDTVAMQADICALIAHGIA